jgi:hypothetical protein
MQNYAAAHTALAEVFGERVVSQGLWRACLPTRCKSL